MTPCQASPLERRTDAVLDPHGARFFDLQAAYAGREDEAVFRYADDRPQSAAGIRVLRSGHLARRAEPDVDIRAASRERRPVREPERPVFAYRIPSPVGRLRRRESLPAGHAHWRHTIVPPDSRRRLRHTGTVGAVGRRGVAGTVHEGNPG